VALRASCVVRSSARRAETTNGACDNAPALTGEGATSVVCTTEAGDGMGEATRLGPRRACVGIACQCHCMEACPLLLLFLVFGCYLQNYSNNEFLVFGLVKYCVLRM